MRKLNSLYMTFMVVIVITSCTTTKEITMFQDKDILNRYDIPPKAPEHKIRPFDNLYLSVKTMEPEVNALFNPSSQGDGFSSSTQQMFGTPEGRDINGYRVSKEGTIEIPIIGEIQLVGLSLDEAKERIKEKAEEYLIDPTIQVKFLNYKVDILGEVARPGIYYNYEGNLNVLDAISMAGGISDFADLENALLKRQNGDRIVTHAINLADNSVYTSDIFYLQPNDLVYIPPSKLKRRRENVQTYNQLLATISTLLVAVALVK